MSTERAPAATLRSVAASTSGRESLARDSRAPPRADGVLQRLRRRECGGIPRRAQVTTESGTAAGTGAAAPIRARSRRIAA